MKFKDIQIGDTFVSPNHIAESCLKVGHTTALTEYGNTMFDREDEIFPVIKQAE